MLYRDRAKEPKYSFQIEYLCQSNERFDWRERRDCIGMFLEELPLIKDRYGAEIKQIDDSTFQIIHLNEITVLLNFNIGEVPLKIHLLVQDDSIVPPKKIVDPKRITIGFLDWDIDEDDKQHFVLDNLYHAYIAKDI